MKTIHKISAAGAVLLRATAALAQPLAPEGIYTPNAPKQSPPMRVETLDGATFKDIETAVVYRLYGVDTCDHDQIANLGRQPWQCGVAAIAWLTSATLGKWVSCNVLREKDGRKLARCSSSEHADLAADMLKEGVALTLPAEDDQRIRAYDAAQEQARKAYRGLWSSQFAMPWDFRSKKTRP